MIVKLANLTYDCFITPRESADLRGSQLETELIDGLTNLPMGKQVTLKIGTLPSGDADNEMVPKNSSFNKATGVRLIMRDEVYERLQNTGQTTARLPYGDLMIYVEEDLSPFEPRGAPATTD